MSFFLVIGVLIFVHELGHFLTAKWVGIGVHRFSIGLGPATPLKFRRGETEYLLAWIPFGGYVKMASREEQQEMEALEGGQVEQVFPPEKMFESKPLWARILVISAGVLMNILFAWVVYSGLTWSQGRLELQTTRPAQLELSRLPDSIRGADALPEGVAITAVDGQAVSTWTQLQEAIRDGDGDRIRFDLASGFDPVVLSIDGDSRGARRALAATLEPYLEAKIGAMVADRPAAVAGLLPGDRIVAIDGQTVESWNEMVTHIEAGGGRELRFTVEREQETLELGITPAQETVKDPATGEIRQVGRIGVNPYRETSRVEVGFLGSLAQGAKETWQTAQLVLTSLADMARGRISFRELGGPIMIGQVAGQMADAGWVPLALFTAFLSINLAILNLLPIPVLDGGHLIFLVYEGIVGRPLPLAMRQRLLQVGLFLLLGLMIFAVGNDLFRVFLGR